MNELKSFSTVVLLEELFRREKDRLASMMPAHTPTVDEVMNPLDAASAGFPMSDPEVYPSAVPAAPREPVADRSNGKKYSCSGCGQPTTLPFVPKTNANIYCRTCYERRK